MVAKWIKIVRKENNKEKIFQTIEKILGGNLGGLDIVSIIGKKGYFRCRIGNIRIIFFIKDGQYFVDSVGYRGNIYKK